MLWHCVLHTADLAPASQPAIQPASQPSSQAVNARAICTHETTRDYEYVLEFSGGVAGCRNTRCLFHGWHAVPMDPQTATLPYLRSNRLRNTTTIQGHTKYTRITICDPANINCSAEAVGFRFRLNWHIYIYYIYSYYAKIVYVHCAHKLRAQFFFLIFLFLVMYQYHGPWWLHAIAIEELPRI